MPGILKNIFNNKKNKVPFRVFETGDIIKLTNNINKEGDLVGSINEKKLAVAYFDVNTSGFDELHGVLD